MITLKHRFTIFKYQKQIIKLNLLEYFAIDHFLEHSF